MEIYQYALHSLQNQTTVLSGPGTEGGGYKMPDLSWNNVLLASSFFLIDFAISFTLNLRITRPLVISATRCLIQLTIMGFILEDLFRQRNPFAIAATTFVLVLLTTFETAFNKAEKSFRGVFISVFICTFVSIHLIGVVGIRFAIHKVPFWSPEMYIPTIGLLLGLTVNAMAMAMNSLVGDLVDTGGDRVEAMLAMGGTRWEATQTQTQNAVRLAMLPSIQRMSIAGLIVIPGAMAGQIMSGASVTNSARYQQIILFMVTACSSLACMLLVTIVRTLLLDPQHRLRRERIHEALSLCDCLKRKRSR